eukprot:m.545913 g.545913  ORF g.545913 m.545913 type:complete len:149 (-) comp22148_c2_seq5:160-606(-)
MLKCGHRLVFILTPYSELQAMHIAYWWPLHVNGTVHLAGEEDDMRVGANLEDPRLASLENTEGYKALKKAQQEAFKLSDAANAYDKRFSTGGGKPSGGTPTGRSSVPGEDSVDIATLHNIWHAEFSPNASPAKRTPSRAVPGRIKTFI